MPAMLSREPFGFSRFSYCSAWLAVTEDDPILALKLCQGGVVANVVSFGMCNRNSQY